MKKAGFAGFFIVWIFRGMAAWVLDGTLDGPGAVNESLIRKTGFSPVHKLTAEAAAYPRCA